MIIDESLIAEGITPKILDELIQEHTKIKGKYKHLYDYYLGNHSIKHREKKSTGTANNKIVCNHAKYIVDMLQSYLVGNPVTYSASDGIDIEPLKDAYYVQDISNLDSELEKNVGIYGRAYEQIYSDNESTPKSFVLNPRDTFVVYDNTAQQKPLFAVYYYKRYDLNGAVIGVNCTVYTDSWIFAYTNNTDSWLAMQMTDKQQHYFGNVPIIEYRNNNECQGDYEQLISLIDAYNTLQSDRINDKEQFVDAFLFLCGVEIDSDQAKKLKEERILLAYGDTNAKAEYLSKNMTEADIKVLRDDLKADICRFSMVPDLSDESFGNNLSGVAIKYKLLSFEQYAKNKERYFAKGLKQRFEIYNNFLSLKAQMSVVPVQKIDIVFNRNLPSNELEIAQMINYLKGTVSSETLIGQLDFVQDPKEEVEIVKSEQEESQAQRIKANEVYTQKAGY